MNKRNLMDWNAVRKMILLVVCICSCTFSLFAQNERNVSGVVTDASGETLPGVSITVKGINTGTISDAEGKYTLNIPDKAVLIFSYLGFAKQEVNVGGRQVLNIKLVEDAVQFDEVVVIGYGTVKKTTLAGAVVALNNKEIVTTKNADVQNSLTGKMAGVKVVQNSSEPGTFDVSFSIRGLGNPLFVIDGVPRENMAQLDPNEVESISVLKDGSAAIYGTRAANGVVLITTKKGTKGQKFQFDYNTYIGTETFLNSNKPLDAIGFMQLTNERNFNSGRDNVVFGKSQFQSYFDGTKKSSDWYTPFVNPHPLEMQHNISATGGTEKMTFYAGLGYTEQEGRWADNKTKYQRYNLRSNVSAELAKGLKTTILLNLMQDNRRYQSSESWRIFDQSWNNYPTSPIYLPDPITGEENTKYVYRTLYTHPGVTCNQDVSGYNINLKNLVQTNLALDWEIPGVKGLVAKGMYSYDFQDDDIKQVRKKVTSYDDLYVPIEGADGSIYRKDRKKLNSLWQASFVYDNTFGGHHVGALALYEESSRDLDNYWVQRFTVFSTIDELKAGTVNGIQGDQDGNDNNLYSYTNKGYVGRVAYDYLSKYIFDFSFRYDGSSKFGPGYQWGFFPVWSLGWRPSEEAFIKNNESLKFINNIKIRGTYGEMGDDSFAAFQFLTGFSYPYTTYGNGYVFNDKPTTGLYPIATPNKEFTWVTSKNLNLGLDFELWNGLLGGVMDVFQRERSGFPGRRTSTLPVEAGIDLPYENINSDSGRGFEVTLTHRYKVGDFRYNLSAHVAMDRNKISYYERGPLVNSYDQWTGAVNNRWGGFRGADQGYAPYLGSIWGYDYKGQYQSFQEIWDSGLIYDAAGNIHMLPGDLIYDDWNGDGIIDGNDSHPIGKNHNALSYGITIGAEWKGFDVNMVWQGTGQNRRNAGDVSGFFSLAVNNDSNGLDVFLDRWHRTDEFNPSIDQEWVPGHYPSNYTNNGRNFILASSNFWFLDATYLRLKTVELGYTLPDKWIKKAGLQRARLFFNGYNMLTFTKYTIMDPEQTKTYPLVKSYNGGISLTF